MSDRDITIEDIRKNYRTQNNICIECRASEFVFAKKGVDFQTLVCNLDGDFEIISEKATDEEHYKWVKQHEVSEYGTCNDFIRE